MKSRYWGAVSRKVQWQQTAPANSFTGKDRDTAINEFKSKPENATLWNRLNETKERLPWVRYLVESLQSQIIHKGMLSDKQRSLATSLYLDACITTDDKIFEQREARKLGYRLMELNLGRVQQLVSDIMYRTDSRAFTLAQIRAFQNIAKRQRLNLMKVPKLIDGETFDGWFKITPDAQVDNNGGL
jgi:hypothetical protein